MLETAELLAAGATPQVLVERVQGEGDVQLPHHTAAPLRRSTNLNGAPGAFGGLRSEPAVGLRPNAAGPRPRIPYGLTRGTLDNNHSYCGLGKKSINIMFRTLYYADMLFDGTKRKRTNCIDVSLSNLHRYMYM